MRPLLEDRQRLIVSSNGTKPKFKPYPKALELSGAFCLNCAAFRHVNPNNPKNPNHICALNLFYGTSMWNCRVAKCGEINLIQCYFQ
jgi:hypothetical protein